jgi:hypothetical protein
MNLPPTSRPIRLGGQTTGEDAIETTVDAPPAGRGAGLRRQPPTHYAPKAGVKAEVRPWAAGPGQDVALELIDLSELGVRVRLRLPDRVSGRFEVIVRNADGRRWIKGMAAIAWSVRSPDGTVVALLTFGQPLLPHVVSQLGDRPVPAPMPGPTPGDPAR